jgi:putative transposase
MEDLVNIRQGRNCIFQMHVHLVFLAKYRGDVFDDDAARRLRVYFFNICSDFEGDLKEMSGGSDYVQLLVQYPAKISVSSLVSCLKAVSSRRLHKDRPELGKYYFKGALWASSYLACSCGEESMDMVHQFIEENKTHPENGGRRFRTAKVPVPSV